MENSETSHFDWIDSSSVNKTKQHVYEQFRYTQYENSFSTKRKNRKINLLKHASLSEEKVQSSNPNHEKKHRKFLHRHAVPTYLKPASNLGTRGSENPSESFDLHGSTNPNREFTDTLQAH